MKLNEKTLLPAYIRESNLDSFEHGAVFKKCLILKHKLCEL